MKPHQQTKTVTNFNQQIFNADSNKDMEAEQHTTLLGTVGRKWGVLLNGDQCDEKEQEVKYLEGTSASVTECPAEVWSLAKGVHIFQSLCGGNQNMAWWLTSQNSRIWKSNLH